MPSAALFVGNLLYHSLPDWLESVREYQFGPDDIAAAFCNISNAPAFFGLSASEPVVDDRKIEAFAIHVRLPKAVIMHSGVGILFRVEDKQCDGVFQLLGIDHLISKRIHKAFPELVAGLGCLLNPRIASVAPCSRSMCWNSFPRP